MSTLFDRKAITDDILLRLGIMEGVIKWHTSRGHNDDAKVAEDVVARFLSALCGWSLVNLNTIRPNYPAADLGDPTERIAIQVTVNGTTDKVRETHEKAITHKLSEDFDTLIILFLLESAPGDPRKSSTFKPCDKPKIEKWARPQISARLDAQKDESPAAHLARLRHCLGVLREEMSAITHILSPALPHRPRKLPFASIRSYLKGRDSFLDSLHAALATSGSAAIQGHAIRGDGGIGKTCVAVEYAWRHQFDYDALLFVTADSPDSLETNLAALGGPEVLNLPGHSGKQLPEQLAAVLQYCQTQSRWLLILDNVDTVEAMTAVKARLTALAGGRIIITTRRNIPVRQLTTLQLDYLSPADSIALLEDSSRGGRIPAADDSAAVAELAHLLGGLPLALSQAAAHISYVGLSYRGYLQLWEQNTAAALAWHNEEVMDYPRPLAITYETSVAQLSPGAKFLLQQLAWCAPDPIPYSLPGVEVFTAEQKVLIAELTNLSLAKKGENGSTFTLHRLIQEITRQQQQEDGGTPPGFMSAGDHSPGVSLVPRDTPGYSQGTPPGFTDHHLPPGETSDLSPTTAALSATTAAQAFTPEGWPMNSRGSQTPGQPNNDDPNPGGVPPSPVPSAPPALTAALSWLNDLFLGDPDDVRTWPVIEPLAPHARAVALSAAECAIPEPSGRLLNQVAIFYNTKAQHQSAEPLMWKVLELNEKMRGPKDPVVATSLNNLALLLKATNRLAEAEPLYRRALAIDEESYGPSHPDVAIDLNNLAQLLQATNRLAEAEPLMRRALAIDEESYGSSHPNVAVRLNNLAQLLQATNRLAEAEPLMERVVSIFETTYGKSHPDVARALNNLATLYYSTDRLEEAEPLMRRALAIDEESYGPLHPNVAGALNNLAQLLQVTNRLAEAEPLMRRHLEIFIDFTVKTGHPHPHLQAAIGNYAGLLRKMGWTEAEIGEKIGKLLEPLGLGE